MVMKMRYQLSKSTKILFIFQKHNKNNSHCNVGLWTNGYKIGKRELLMTENNKLTLKCGAFKS